jgi:hypothetical protein
MPLLAHNPSSVLCRMSRNRPHPEGSKASCRPAVEQWAIENNSVRTPDNYRVFMRELNHDRNRGRAVRVSLPQPSGIQRVAKNSTSPRKEMRHAEHGEQPNFGQAIAILNLAQSRSRLITGAFYDVISGIVPIRRLELNLVSEFSGWADLFCPGYSSSWGG